MKPLDFVRTPAGVIALITETHVTAMSDGRDHVQASIAFIGKWNADWKTFERSAWWDEDDGLVVIDSLPYLLARNLTHPFGSGAKDADRHFGQELK